ncbi:restriction endonuclease subunit S, partial [Clostridium perfringens]
GAQTFMSLSTIKKLNIVVPELEIQNEYEMFIKKVDKLKFEMEKSLKELEDNFNSLMQKAFKGELFK